MANKAIRGFHFLRRVFTLAAPYWKSEDRLWAWGLFVAIVGLTLGIVYVNVLFNAWNRAFYNALQELNWDAFVANLIYFGELCVVYIAAQVAKYYLNAALQIRWRVWLTGRYVSAWMKDQVYYRLELDRHGTDNPDQRISEDIRDFTSGTLGFVLGVLSSAVTLVSFLTILWVISGPLAFAVAGTSFEIPGYMVWVAFGYAIVGTALTHLVGRRLVPLNFDQERFEADFRFSLVRLRENAEGVALYGGEPTERTGLLDRFERIRANWWRIMNVAKNVVLFQAGYGQIAIIFPILVAAPRYFAKAIDLGTLFQISDAFGQVQGSLSWFIDNYQGLASWKASVDRLLTFENALRQAEAEAQAGGGIEVVRDGAGAVKVENLDLLLPNGRVVQSDAALDVRPGDHVLISGPTGSGKTTLFRAIAGIWPYGRGTVEIPADARMLFLPQRPYIPIASLREAIAYPAGAGTFDDAAIRDVLQEVGLGRFKERLDEVQNWSMQMSIGEQQRLAFGRALLQQPEWLFLDEATAALDEAGERHLYELLQQRLPNATVVSIAHRPHLAAYHARTIALSPEPEQPAMETPAPAAGSDGPLAKSAP